MATVNLGDINIPAGDSADVLAAMQAEFATVSIPTPTQAQCLERLRQEVITRVKSLTKRYRQQQAAIADPNLT